MPESQAKKMIAASPMFTVPDVGHAPSLQEPAFVEALDRFLAPVTAKAPV